jgi:hypothetical protein
VRDNLANGDNPKSWFLNQGFFIDISMFLCLKKRTAEGRLFSLIYTKQVSYFSLLINTYFILLSKCLPILIIAWFLFILLQYRLYIISIAGSLLISIQELSINAVLRRLLHLWVIPLSFFLSPLSSVLGVKPT